MNLNNLIQKYPNDADLGKAVRSLFTIEPKRNFFDELKAIESNCKIKIQTNCGFIISTEIIKNDVDGKMLITKTRNIGYENVKMFEIL